MINQLRFYFEKLEHVKNRTIMIVFSFLTVLMALTLFIYQNTFSYEVYLNSNSIGIVQEKTIADSAIDSVKHQVEDKYGTDANYDYDINIEQVRVNKDQIMDQSQLQNLIFNNLDIFKPAAVITIDGEDTLVLRNKEEADSILENIKDPFVSDIAGDGNAKVLNVGFTQQVEVVEKNVPADKINTKETALEEIQKTKEQMKTYEIVSGDNAWTVSRAFDTGLSNLEEANPGKDMADLMPGDTINLVVDKPYIDVAVTIQKTTTEDIDFDTEKEETSSLYVGQSKVKQQGKKGQKEVTKEITYVNNQVDKETVIDEKVITEPTKKIVLVGTKARPAVKYSSSKTVAPTYKGDLGSSIVATAKHYLGLPYRSGGSTPAGFDCSGFTSYVYRQYGIHIPRSSGGQAGVGGYVAKSNLRPGDLVVFSGHVGIYVGNNRFIHSPRPGKSIMISSLSESYWRATYRSGRRVY